MFPRLPPGEHETGRARPARRARWQAYLAPVGLATAGLVAAIAPAPLVTWLAGFGLTTLGGLLVTGAALVLATTALVGWLSEHPLATLLAGALALSLGANVLPARWIALPLLLLGLLWVGVLELQRAFSGVVLTNRHVHLLRPLRPSLSLSYGEIHVAHTTGQQGTPGALILETEHGTVTATHLPKPGVLAERIDARKGARPLEPAPQAVSEARGRIRSLLSGRKAA